MQAGRNHSSSEERERKVLPDNGIGWACGGREMPSEKFGRRHAGYFGIDLPLIKKRRRAIHKQTSPGDDGRNGWERGEPNYALGRFA